MQTNRYNETKKHVYRFWWLVLVVTATLLPFCHYWMKRLNPLLHEKYLNKGNILMYIIYVILMLVFASIFGGFKVGVGQKTHLYIGQAVAYLCLNCMEIMITILMIGRVKYIRIICSCYGKLYLIQLVILFLFTNFGTDLYRKIIPPYRMIEVYGNYRNNLRRKMNRRRDKYIIKDGISCDAPEHVIEESLKEYDAVLINDIPSEKRNIILKHCFENGQRVYFTPKISDIMVKSAECMTLFDTPLYLSRNMELTLVQRFIKRAMDIVISLVGIIITSPIMLITAIAVFAYDRGPVLYKQERCTINGKVYKICKFRSMIVNAEKDGKARLATEKDDRITPVGKVIRAMRIDELPQFFNILAGSMSIVGPRPERPELIEKNCKEVPEFAYRMHVKAGLTGYAQVYGKYNTTFLDKLKMDLIYVNNYSIFLDIKLILLTLKIIFIKESTEGVQK